MPPLSVLLPPDLAGGGELTDQRAEARQRVKDGLLQQQFGFIVHAVLRGPTDALTPAFYALTTSVTLSRHTERRRCSRLGGDEHRQVDHEHRRWASTKARKPKRQNGTGLIAPPGCQGQGRRGARRAGSRRRPLPPGERWVNRANRANPPRPGFAPGPRGSQIRRESGKSSGSPRGRGIYPIPRNYSS